MLVEEGERSKKLLSSSGARAPHNTKEWIRGNCMDLAGEYKWGIVLLVNDFGTVLGVAGMLLLCMLLMCGLGAVIFCLYYNK